MSEPAWVCDGCGERVPTGEFDQYGAALDEARAHVGTCPDGEEAVYDDGLGPDDYAIDFDLEGSA